MRGRPLIRFCQIRLTHLTSALGFCLNRFFAGQKKTHLTSFSQCFHLKVWMQVWSRWAAAIATTMCVCCVLLTLHRKQRGDTVKPLHNSHWPIYVNKACLYKLRQTLLAVRKWLL